MANTKGGSFGNTRAFVLERYGAEGWEAARERLTPGDRAELAAMLPVGWYPLALYARLIRAIDDVHGCGDLALVVQLGRYAADREAAAIQRAFARLPNPSYAVDRLGEHWRRFHDSGDWQLERVSDQQIGGALASFGYVDHALCREAVGYVGRLLELVGAKHVLLEHPRCRAHGDAECYFQGRWGAVRDVTIPTTLPASSPRVEPASGAIALTSREAFSASIEALSGRHPIAAPPAPSGTGEASGPRDGRTDTKVDPRKRAGGR